MIYVAFAGFVIMLLIFVGAFLECMATNERRAEFQRLREEYTDLERRHAPREHVRRQLVELQCQELKS